MKASKKAPKSVTKKAPFQKGIVPPVGAGPMMKCGGKTKKK